MLRLTANDGQFNVSDDVSVAVTGANMGLSFDGVSKRVTFGPAPGARRGDVHARDLVQARGRGRTVSTGAGGVAAIPLVTKGMAQADGSNVDMNYFLGIDGTTRVLVADFEDTATGLNHPVQGVTAICDSVWYHAAATYDGTTWRLYLNGQLETTLVVGAFTPRFDSIQHAGLGTALNSTGAASRRVPGRARRAAHLERRAQRRRHPGGDDRAAGLRPGLIGRWGLDEGSGSTVADSSGGGNTGTIQNTAVWVTGTPYVSTPSRRGTTVCA